MVSSAIIFLVFLGVVYGCGVIGLTGSNFQSRIRTMNQNYHQEIEVLSQIQARTNFGGSRNELWPWFDGSLAEFNEGYLCYRLHTG